MCVCACVSKSLEKCLYISTYADRHAAMERPINVDPDVSPEWKQCCLTQARVLQVLLMRKLVPTPQRIQPSALHCVVLERLVGAGGNEMGSYLHRSPGWIPPSTQGMSAEEMIWWWVQTIRLDVMLATKQSTYAACCQFLSLQTAIYREAKSFFRASFANCMCIFRATHVEQ